MIMIIIIMAFLAIMYSTILAFDYDVVCCLSLLLVLLVVSSLSVLVLVLLLVVVVVVAAAVVVVVVVVVSLLLSLSLSSSRLVSGHPRVAPTAGHHQGVIPLPARHVDLDDSTIICYVLYIIHYCIYIYIYI